MENALSRMAARTAARRWRWTVLRAGDARSAPRLFGALAALGWWEGPGRAPARPRPGAKTDGGAMDWTNVFEAVMLVCFGFSWPFNIRKTLKQRSSAGKSFMFVGLVLVGYLAGIAGKLIKGVDYMALLWALNAVLVATDLALVTYYHYRPGGAPAARAVAVPFVPAAGGDQIPEDL